MLTTAFSKEPQLVRDRIWFDFVATMLPGALNRHDPQLRDRLRAATAA